MKNTQNIFIRKPEWKRPLGSSMSRYEDSSRNNLREIVWEVVDWLHLA
jgi:hypothetical protein